MTGRSVRLQLVDGETVSGVVVTYTGRTISLRLGPDVVRVVQMSDVLDAHRVDPDRRAS